MSCSSSYKEAIVDCGNTLVKFGLVKANSGNISLRNTNSFFITPSGRALNNLSCADIIEIDSKGSPIKNTTKFKPSMETGLHLGIYTAHRNAQAIVHVHPLYATIVGTIMELKPLTYEAAMFCDPIDYIPALLPGTQQLADMVAQTKSQVIVLKNHGVVVWGENLQDCVFRLQVIEENAIQTYIAKSLGSIPALEFEQYAKLRKG